MQALVDTPRAHLLSLYTSRNDFDYTRGREDESIDSLDESDVRTDKPESYLNREMKRYEWLLSRPAVCLCVSTLCVSTAHLCIESYNSLPFSP